MERSRGGVKLWISQMLAYPGGVEICEEALKKWGNHAQVGIAIEEYGEFQRALVRSFYQGRADRENLVEEMADFIIVTEQMIINYNLNAHIDDILRSGIMTMPISDTTPSKLGRQVCGIAEMLWAEYDDGVDTFRLGTALADCLLRAEVFVYTNKLEDEVELAVIDKLNRLNRRIDQDDGPEIK